MSYKVKKYFSTFIILRILFDVLSVPFIITMGYSLKFKVGWTLRNVFSIHHGEIYSNAQLEPYLQNIVLLVIVWTITFYFSRVYRTFSGVMPEVDEAVAVGKGILFSTVLVMALTFVFPFIPGSRFVLLYSAVFAFLWLTLGRLILTKIEAQQLKRGVGTLQTLVVGAGSLGQDVVERMFVFPFLRLSYVGHIDDEEPSQTHYHLMGKLKILGKLSEFKEVCLRHHIKVVFVTKEISFQLLEDIIIFCGHHNIEFNQLIDHSDSLSGTVSVIDFDGLPFLIHKSLPDFDMELKTKRFFDVFAALLGLLLLSPVFIIISLIIKVVSPTGPIFYVQERVGLNGKYFGMIKFRTMIPDAEKSGPVFVNESGDDRYIPTGKFLRQYSLDELPQLLNVVKGDMSIVGPRPERPFFVDQFEKIIPHYSLRHRFPVGLTGWAPINGRSVLTRRPEHKIKYDLYYIKNWSLIFDLKIMAKTVFTVIKSEEAY